MNATNIGWTDLSANPIKYRDKRTGKTVWACVKASPGCAHCYAEALALRWNRGSAFLRPNLEHIEPFVDTSELRDMLSPKKLPPGKRVFIEDMSDLFGDWVPSTLVDELLAVLAIRSDVTFQLLTKRADRMAEYFSGRGLGLRIAGKLMPASTRSSQRWWRDAATNARIPTDLVLQTHTSRSAPFSSPRPFRPGGLFSAFQRTPSSRPNVV